jgi:hypothetical protein
MLKQTQSRQRLASGWFDSCVSMEETDESGIGVAGQFSSCRSIQSGCMKHADFGRVVACLLKAKLAEKNYCANQKLWFPIIKLENSAL